MSGLAALFSRDGRPVCRDGIDAMLAAIPYRALDGRQVHLWRDVALGAAKLAVTSQDRVEQQPVVSPSSGCAVVADVRLDNRDELLRLLDGVAATSGDAELILRAYERWGLDMPKRLLGDFAMLIWDPRSRRLLAARDTSGQRSLFYRLDRHTFAASSEIHQLLQNSAVPLAPNEERIYSHLNPFNLFQNEKDQHATFYAGIFAVPAGHLLVVEAEREQLARYWELQPPRELCYSHDEEYADHLRDLLFTIMQGQLRSDRPVGALLSGGLDSSSIVCIAQHLYQKGLVIDQGFATYSTLFGSLDSDERPFIEEMKATYGFQARLFPFREHDGRLRLAPRGFFEAPGSLVPDARDEIFAAAQLDGVRTMLTGNVGDNCLLGSRLVFDSLLRHRQWREFRRHLRAYQRTSGTPLRRTLVLHCLAPFLPLWLQRRLNAVHMQRFLCGSWQRLLPDWMPLHLREDLARRSLSSYLREAHSRRFASPARQLEFDALYPPDVVRFPAPWSIQLAQPFADRRLHEFLLAIPPEQKFAPHVETDVFYAGAKQVLRRAMRGVVPETIRTRTLKTVFSSALVSEVQRQWPLYEAVFGSAGQSEIGRRGLVDHARFWQRLQETRAGNHKTDLLYILEMVQLESWLRSFQQPRSQQVTVADAHPRPTTE